MEQHRAFLALSFREKMEALEGLCDLSLRLLENRHRRGLPYIDPYTGEVVRPPMPAVAVAAAGAGDEPKQTLPGAG